MNFLDINELLPHEIGEIFDLADRVRIGHADLQLKGKIFVFFCPESSIRTRIAFEKGIKDLGGECILFPPESLDKGERLSDVIKYIENWAHGVIVRHADYSKIEELGKSSSIPVINAMSSVNHPGEILSDLYTISKISEDYRELVYTFVGPTSNICRSWMSIAKVMDLNFHHVCEAGNALARDNRNYKFHTNLEEMLKRSDVVLTDSLPEEFRTKAYISKYQISLERMRTAKQGSLLNPCPPFFVNEEVSEDAIASKYFVGHALKKNLIYIQQAIVLYCILN